MSASLTIILVALAKYFVFGGLILDPRDLISNITLGFWAWGANTSITSWATHFFYVKGFKFNLKELFFGYDKMADGPASFFEDNKPAHKLYSAMESNEESGESSNKEKEIYKYSSFLGDSNETTVLPKRIKPGPGFNTPGGDVPAADPIRAQFDWNTHLVTQIKGMSLETAVEQKFAVAKLLHVIKGKLDFANSVLPQIPANTTDPQEIAVRNKILRDIESLTKDGQKVEARATLINSRLEFIDSKINKN